MKITILQKDILWGNPQVNIAKADELIGILPQADLFVLPEMFSTGFCTQPRGMAEDAVAGETLHWMKRTAVARGCAMAGSVMVQEEEKYYNRFYFIYPDGTVRYYDKRHLFTYGGEHHNFTAGSERIVVDFCNMRILLQVCYDLRFPVWARNTGDYDMILYVASWPTSRIDVWNTLLKARAIENQCYVVGVNRVGVDPNCDYLGGSVVIDPYGKILAGCEEGMESYATVTVDRKLLDTFRTKFPVLSDADSFTLNCSSGR